jgi:hypothetical protein
LQLAAVSPFYVINRKNYNLAIVLNYDKFPLLCYQHSFSNSENTHRNAYVCPEGLQRIIKSFCCTLEGKSHWGDPDVDGRIILRWVFRKWEGVVGTGWSWLRIGTGGEHF